MFKFGREDGLDVVVQRFATMLEDARFVFDGAVDARLRAADPEVTGPDVLAAEDRTDEAERDIRRRVLVHASVRGRSADLPSCFRFMSVAKDAERIGDLSRQIFGIAKTVGPAPSGEVRDDLLDLAGRISPLIWDVAEAFRDDDVERAGELDEAIRGIQDRCRARIDALLREELVVPQLAATTLTYRQFARVSANLRNILSAVTQSLDLLDYPDRH